MSKKARNFASFRQSQLSAVETSESPTLPKDLTKIYNDETPSDVPAIGDVQKADKKAPDEKEETSVSVAIPEKPPLVTSGDIGTPVRAEARISEAENRVIALIVRREKARRKKESGIDGFDRQTLVREALLKYVRELDPEFDKKVKKAEAFLADL